PGSTDACTAPRTATGCRLSLGRSLGEQDGHAVADGIRGAAADTDEALLCRRLERLSAPRAGEELEQLLLGHAGLTAWIRPVSAKRSRPGTSPSTRSIASPARNSAVDDLRARRERTRTDRFLIRTCSISKPAARICSASHQAETANSCAIPGTGLAPRRAERTDDGSSAKSRPPGRRTRRASCNARSGC